MRFLAALLLSGLFGVVPGRAAPPRVGVGVDVASGREGMQGALTAELSRLGVEIVERDELSSILSEHEVQAAPFTGFSNVDVFLHFRNTSPGFWLIEKVDAASGSITGSVTTPAGGSEPAASLAAAARDLLRAPEKIPDKARPRVAVVEGAVEGEADPRIFILAARLRDALMGAQFRVLDRALTQEVVSENAAAESGWREDLPKGAFLGVEDYVELAARGGDCEVRVFRADGGQVLGSRVFRFDGPGAVDLILPWLVPLLGQTPGTVQPYLPSVEIEALEPFYRGLSLFDAGLYAEASAEFSRALLRNDKFRDAILWEARCYDALGLAPLAAAMRRYADVGLVGNGASASARIQPAEALAFLGVEGVSSKALSAAAASELCHTGREIRLPDSLERLRREYDWMAGQSLSEGTRWEQTPSFFCRTSLKGEARQGANGTIVLWALRDTVGGKTIAKREQVLSPEPARWASEIRGCLDKLLSEESACPGNHSSEIPKESVAELESAFLRNRGLEANAALVKLAIADPSNPLLRSKGFERGESKRDGIDAFANFGLRDYLISRLPENSPFLPWLRLARIYSFAESDPSGRLLSGERWDAVAELEKFARQNAMSPAALAARYSVLFARQDEIPPAVLEGQCEALAGDLRREDDFPRKDWLITMVLALRDFARIAAGNIDVPFPPAKYSELPHGIRINWTADGSPSIEQLGGWVTNEYAWVDLEPGEKVTEARAALAINGRRSEHHKIDDRWFGEFPNSIILASFASSSIHELNFSLGQPLVHALDWEAERASFLKAVAYVGGTLEYWIGRARSPKGLDNLENMVWEFLMALNERAYLGVFPESDYLALRDRLAKRMDETNARVGRAGWAWKQDKYCPWREMTPADARKERQDRLDVVGREVYDRGALLAGLARAENTSGGVFDPIPWWNRLRSWEFYDVFSPPELAELYMRHTPEILGHLAGKGLTEQQDGYLYEHALALFYGGLKGEAEKLFTRILDDPPSEYARTIQANAAFRLAQIYRLDGRKAEAIEMARRGLGICGQTSLCVLGRLYEANFQGQLKERGVAGGLAGHLIRLLAEMRYDPGRARLPDRVEVVSVPTPNADNPLLHVFYRRPPEGSARELRALVLVPSLNHDVLDYLAPDGAWARFADANGLVLICPKFYCSERADRAGHAFAYYLYPQVWSGKALLDSLGRISEKVPLRKDGLLFHSYGAGAGFVCRFARWRPDLVSAVSLNGGGTALSWFQESPGLLPFSASRNVRFFVTGGTDDDYAANTQNRFACSESLVTVLRGAGATTEWKPLPGVAHFPTPEMEEASREFLARQ